ncbi:MAG: hypoxanthine phosphoribosyltransferase [Verrucomicrobiota bacterium]
MLEPGDVLITAEAIQARVADLAEEIRAHYAEPPVLLGLMNGALFFLNDLLRCLPPEAEFQCSTISSYAGTKSTGRIRGLDTISEGLRGREVLVIDDVLDTGLTLSEVRAHLRKLGAGETRICVLLRKNVERSAEVEAHWVGFDIGEEFVVGYGLDYDGKYRSFEDIRVMRDTG